MLNKLFNLSLTVEIIPNGDTVQPCGGGVSTNGDVGISCGPGPKPTPGCGGCCEPPVVEPL